MSQQRIEKYGVRWPAGRTPLHVELGLYASEKVRSECPGKRSKWEHLRNAIKMHMPENVFKWHRWVDEAGEEWCENTQLNIWGAGGTTKSGIIGLLCYYDLLASPKNTLIVMVTNPLEKHWDRCFSKTTMWRKALPVEYQIGRVVKSPKPALITVDGDEGSRRGILCISIDKGETGMEIGKKVGAHAPRTRLILEEGQTLPKDTLNIATNLFMGSMDKKEVIIGNPMAWQNNALGEASKPVSGDTKSIDKDQPNRWYNARTHGDLPGVTLVFDGLRAPTFDSPEEAKRLAGIMIQPRDIESARKIPGAENTLNFWSQVRGRIPPAGQVLTVFGELDWDAVGVSIKHEWLGGYDQYASADLSLGGDAIPVYRWGVGLTKELGMIAQKLESRYIQVNIEKPDRSGQIGEQYAKILVEWGIKDLKVCSADCSGQQGAIADTMERKAHAAGIPGYIYRVRSEEAVTERQISTGKILNAEGAHEVIRERACDRYKDRATELVMNLPEAIQNRLIWNLDDIVKDQLCGRGFDPVSLEGGAIKVQKKKDWIEQHEGKSPDELDAVCVFVAHVFEKRILVPGRDTKPKGNQMSTLPKWMQKGAKACTYAPRSSQIARAMRRRG
jgi:hypothetical protein